MNKEQRWIREPLGDGMDRLWRVDEVLWEQHTGFQRALIGRTAHGVSLFCDDDRQSTELSQLVYHEALMIPGLLLAESLRRVLIVGSSEGVASRLAIAAGAQRVDHVDIDRVCVRACAEHLPYGYDPDELARAERGEGAVHVHYTDGWEFVRGTGERYDLIVVDLPDEQLGTDAQHNRLYGKEFLTLCRGLLSPGGVVAVQAGCPTLWRNQTLIAAVRRFGELFGTTVYFGSDEHEWAFLFGRAESLADPGAVLTERLAGLPFEPASIDAGTLVSATVLPHAVRRESVALQEAGT